MKIIGFVGSPRNDGTTAYLIKQILAGAASAGAETNIHYLNELTFKGCQGCRKCKDTGFCDLKDDLTPIYEEIIEADAIIVGSPVYMAYVTGQTKLFLDRLYAFKKKDQTSRIPAGKRCVLVLTQGYDDTAAYSTMVKAVSSLLERFGLSLVETMVVGGVNSPEDEDAKKAGDKAFSLGLSLV